MHIKDSSSDPLFWFEAVELGTGMSQTGVVRAPNLGQASKALHGRNLDLTAPLVPYRKAQKDLAIFMFGVGCIVALLQFTLISSDLYIGQQDWSLRGTGNALAASIAAVNILAALAIFCSDRHKRVVLLVAGSVAIITYIAGMVLIGLAMVMLGRFSPGLLLLIGLAAITTFTVWRHLQHAVRQERPALTIVASPTTESSAIIGTDAVALPRPAPGSVGGDAPSSTSGLPSDPRTVEWVPAPHARLGRRPYKVRGRIAAEQFERLVTVFAANADAARHEARRRFGLEVVLDVQPVSQEESARESVRTSSTVAVVCALIVPVGLIVPSVGSLAFSIGLASGIISLYRSKGRRGWLPLALLITLTLTSAVVAAAAGVAR